MLANINGTRMAYSDNGAGRSLVFLHAFPLNRTMWAPQEAYLSRRFRIVTVDLRGHGESDAPLWHYSLEHYADDVNGLLDHLAIEQAVLIGLSMGGYVAFAFYRKYAHRVQALVLADTRASADSADARTGRFNLAQTAYRNGAGAVAKIMLPKLLGATSFAERPGIVGQVRHMIETCEVSGIVADSMAMAERPDSMSLLSMIRCPTLDPRRRRRPYHSSVRSQVDGTSYPRSEAVHHSRRRTLEQHGTARPVQSGGRTVR